MDITLTVPALAEPVPGWPPCAPRPESADTPTDFLRELRRYKAWSGDPSLLSLQRSTGVPRSTLGDALNPRRTTLPPLDLVLRVVRACGAGPAEVDRWQGAWRRMKAAETV